MCRYNTHNTRIFYMNFVYIVCIFIQIASGFWTLRFIWRFTYSYAHHHRRPLRWFGVRSCWTRVLYRGPVKWPNSILTKPKIILTHYSSFINRRAIGFVTLARRNVIWQVYIIIVVVNTIIIIIQIEPKEHVFDPNGTAPGSWPSVFRRTRHIRPVARPYDTRGICYS